MQSDEDSYISLKNEAKSLFVVKKYAEAYLAYQNCVKVCAFKDQLVTLQANMAMCSIKVNKYERAFADC